MSERIEFTDKNLQEVAHKAAEVLRAGGVVLYPTDTLYALGADSFNKEAVEKIYSIKGRDTHKTLSSVVADIDAAALYAPVTPMVQEMADKFLPGKLTLVLSDTFSVRIPAHAFCLLLADMFGKPYTATSANKSGVQSQHSVDAILAQLGSSASSINLIVDAGELPDSLPSTVVDVRGDKPVVLRRGTLEIPVTDLKNIHPKRL